MKNFFTILILAVACLTLRAQSIPGPQPFQLFTNTGAIYLPGSTTTNIPVTMAQLIPVGKNGIRWYFGMGATNAASTTNATVWIELLNIDTFTGTTNVIDNLTNSLTVPQAGLTRYDYETNMLPTSPNYGNGSYFRVRSVQNTNDLGIFITNAVAYIRE